MERKLPNGLYFKIIGYILTATWLAFILFATRGNTEHDLFAYIFVVPLVCWVVGKLAAYFVSRKVV